MQIIMTIGNDKLMERDKTLFICSKHTPINLYEYVFRWVDSLTKDDCIACFNSTEMEAEVLKALLVAKIPTVLFVMNRFTDVNNIQVTQALKEKRLLIAILKRDEPRGAGLTPRLRNKYVLSICSNVACGYVNKNGNVFSLLAGKTNVSNIIDDSTAAMVADTDSRRERWTVAQDKVLLRMFYEDMGIHAIHKKLSRTYQAVYTRIKAITQSESTLKGREFEDFVLSLFPFSRESELALLEWQGDKSFGNIKPENNSHPDLVLRYGKEEFAVECKWRERLKYNAKNDIFTEKSIRNYEVFSQTRNMPVTAVIGLGGEPSNPEHLYIVPLEKVRATFDDTNNLARYEFSGNFFDKGMFIRKKKRRYEKKG